MTASAKPKMFTVETTIPDRTGFWTHLEQTARTTHPMLHPITLRAAIKNRCRYEAAMEFDGMVDDSTESAAYELFFEKLYDSLTREAEARGFRL